MQLAARISLGLSLLATTPAFASDWLTSSALIGTSKYADFEHYDYVNPDAPKGGTVNDTVTGTFDSFNPFIVRGAPAIGLSAFGGLLYDTLFQQSTDEPGVSHPLVAEAFKYADDYSSATYRLDPKAKFQDGTTITPADVIWSFETLKRISPQYNKYFANVVSAAETAPGEVTFTFDQTGNRELPHIMGDLAVLPKAWWTGTDAQGKARNIDDPTLEPPLGSGAWRIASFEAGKEIVWERVKDYWAASKPVNVGRLNVERRVYRYFLDDNARWQAFTKGGFQDIRIENRSQKWATEYNFPAFQAGDVIKQEFEQHSGEPMQGYVFNLRRPQFADRRVRQALSLAFDFESMNRTLFYGLYTRTDSFFEGGELASSGLPEGEELALLEPLRGKVPDEVFTTPFVLPVYDRPDSERTYLRQAYGLLKDAGWVTKDGKLVNGKTGEPFRIEFLGSDPIDERVAGPYMANLRKLGVDATLRVVDAAQYEARVESFDFDMLPIASFAQSLSPGNEQRDFFSSAAADTRGSRNLFGLKDPSVDALIDKVIFAKDRPELIAATHALDRVLLWDFIIVPQWHNPKVWSARWDKFGMPDKLQGYLGVDLDSWWIDPAKDAALAAKYQNVK
jgi:microcin C transport system substrate-binding protein